MVTARNLFTTAPESIRAMCSAAYLTEGTHEKLASMLGVAEGSVRNYALDRCIAPDEKLKRIVNRLVKHKGRDRAIAILSYVVSGTGIEVR